MNKLDELYQKALVTNATETSEEGMRRKEAAKKTINDALSVIFSEMPKLNVIRVQGSTPGFNDGDPCYHSQLQAVDVYDPDYLFESVFGEDSDDPDLRDMLTGEKLDWSHTSYDRETRKSSPNPLPEDAHHAACIKALEVVSALSEEFEIVYDTNFTLDIVRDSNEALGFRIDHSDYDCGY